MILFYQMMILIGWIGAVEAVGSEHEQKKAVSCEHSRKE